MATLLVPDWLLVFAAYAVAYGFWYKEVVSLIYNAVYGMNYYNGCAFVAAALALSVLVSNLAIALSLSTSTPILSEPLLLLPFVGSLLLELPLLYFFAKCFLG